jgi:hypothetical protein
VQVNPIKATMKAPGTERWKLECHEPLSNLALDLNLRRYIMESCLQKVPPGYATAHRRLAAKGFRVIALCAKAIQISGAGESGVAAAARAMPRAQVRPATFIPNPYNHELQPLNPNP